MLTFEKVTRVNETSSHDETTEAFASHVASLALATVSAESVEEGRVDQSGYPDHTGRPDDELAN